jgi:hypothetical protein
MIDDPYDALDRATIATWQLGNQLVWAGAALLAAAVLHQVVDEMLQRYVSSIHGGINLRPQTLTRITSQFSAQFGARAGVAIAVGVLIGGIVGLKVWKRTTAVAGVTGLAYLALSWFALESSVVVERLTGEEPSIARLRHGFPRSGLEWGYSALALLTVVLAPLVARFVARRKAT